MDFRVLGVLKALDDGLPISLGGPKQRSVLAMLLLDANRAVSVDHLIDGVWGDAPPASAAATLQVYVSNLRKMLEPDRSPRAAPSVLLTQAPGYLLSVDADQVDLFRFERLVAEARGLADDGCPAGAAVLFREALAQWRETDPLADLANEPFAAFQITRLVEARTGAVEDRIATDLALGRAVELLPELEALVALYPYRERLRGQLILALYRAGRQTDALAAYQAARRVLVDELGLEPSRELSELEGAILGHDPALDPPDLPPIRPDHVARVLRRVNRAEPSPEVVESVVEEGRVSARRAEDALLRAIDHEQSGRLSEEVAVAGTTQVELIRARRVIADRVLDRRARHVPRLAPSPVPVGETAGNGSALDACPYKGLLRFEPEDAGWYFGREQLVAELLAAIASNRCTGIVGASGSGKSSLTRAGLLATLGDDALPGSAGWPRLLVTPGGDPMLELARALAPVSHAPSASHVRAQLLDDPESLAALTARALRGVDGNASVVIVVDQLEEIFTVCRDHEVRERFLDVLVAASADPDSRTRIFAAIRADYYARCAEHSEFARLLGQSNVLVGPMRPDELQRAIELPAHRAGLVLEHGLVDRIFDDVGTEPGSLPLLETALLETWNRRDGRTLTLAGYEASGGVQGAVANLADDVYTRLPPPDQDIVRALFLRLAEPGVGTDDVRRRAPLDELVVDDAHAAVLATLVDHRLVVTSDSTAEVAHEALLREWPRLRTWLEEDREGRRLQRVLSNGAQDWAANARNDDLLFRGSRLAAALEAADAHPAEINPIERDFLDAGQAQQESGLRTAQRTAGRFRRLTVALAVLLVVGLAAGGIAIQQGSSAQQSESRAELAARLRDASRLAAMSRTLSQRDYQDRLRLAVESYRLAPGPDTKGALESALVAVPRQRSHTVTFTNGSPLAGITPDGSHILIAAGGELAVVDAESGEVLDRVPLPNHPSPFGVVVSGDGQWAAVGSNGGGVASLVDLSVGRVVAALPISKPLAGFAFDPTDRHRLYVAGQDGTVTLWDLSQPSDPRSRLFATVAPAVSSGTPLFVAVSRDGSRVLVGDSNVGDEQARGPSVVLDASSGEVIATVPGAFGALSADGRYVASILAQQVHVTELATGETVTVPTPTVTNPSSRMTFDEGAARLALTDLDGFRVHVVDWRSGDEVVDPIDLFGIFTFADFLGDGRLFVRNAQRAVVADLDAASAPALVGMPGTRQMPFDARLGNELSFGADGNLQTVTKADGTIAVWDPGDLSRIATEPVPQGVGDDDVLVSPDRRRLVITRFGSDRVTFDVVSRPGDDVVGSRVLHRPDYNEIVWSPDSSSLAITARDGEVLLWRVRPGPGKFRRLYPPSTQPNAGVAAWFSPDSRRVLILRAVDDATASQARVFDVASGKAIATLSAAPGTSIQGAAWHPNGTAVALSVVDFRAGSSTIALMDPRTGSRLDGSPSIETTTLAGIEFVDAGRMIVTLAFATPEGSGGTARFFDTDGLLAIGDPVPLDPDVVGLWVSPDGSYAMNLELLSAQTQGSEITSAVVWDVTPRAWLRTACDIAGRPFTRLEWKKILPDRPYDPGCS